jgi:hypothetical protein
LLLYKIGLSSSRNEGGGVGSWGGIDEYISQYIIAYFANKVNKLMMFLMVFIHVKRLKNVFTHFQHPINAGIN